MSKITDEMVEVAKLAYGDATLGSLNRWAKEPALRAALEAAAPMIRDAALEEAAKVVRVIEAEYRRHAGSVPQTPPRSYAQAKANAVACVKAAIRTIKEQP